MLMNPKIVDEITDAYMLICNDFLICHLLKLYGKKFQASRLHKMVHDCQKY